MNAYHEKTKTAMIPHRCCECLGDIIPGDLYVRVGGVWDGRGQTYKLCLECHDLFKQANALAKEMDCYDEEGPCFHQLYQWLIDAEVIHTANMDPQAYNDMKTRLSVLKEQALSFFREREDDHQFVS